MPMDSPTMATLRRYIAEPDEVTYTDDALNTIYDATGGDVNATAFEVWSDKASRAAILVDTSEGDSSRKNSQVYDHALKQASFFDTRGTTAATATQRGARTRAIERA